MTFYDTRSGNALWIILIGIILLGLLTAMLSRSGSSTNDTGDLERIRIQASDIMRHSRGMEQAISNMITRGASESDLCFDTIKWGNSFYDHAGCAEDKNKVYNINGGALEWKDIPAEIKEGSPLTITGSYNVTDVGTSANELLVQGEVSRAACLDINNLARVTNPSGEPPIDDIGAAGEYKGNFNSAAGDDMIGDQATQLARHKTGCHQNSADDKYFFYHVLIAR